MSNALEQNTIIKLACIQLCTGQNVTKNLQTATKFIRQAAADGAQLIVTPEQTGLMELAGKALFENIHLQQNCPALKHFKALAAELNVFLCIGSLAILNPDNSVANRGFLIDPKGEVVNQYDKIHMFDIKLANGEAYKESATYKAGNQISFTDCGMFKFGHTICYDVRFPKLYNAIAKLGAQIIAVPAAFTVPTGKAHWHVLLRARAIETSCFIMAAAQGGEHENGRKTYGHSMIINPWGEIIAEMKNQQNNVPIGYITAEVDLHEVATSRQNIPVLEHEKPFQ